MFSPEFSVITANNADDAMDALRKGKYEAILVVGVKAKSLPEVPMVRQFVKDGMAKLLSDILADITADAGGKVTTSG